MRLPLPGLAWLLLAAACSTPGPRSLERAEVAASLDGSATLLDLACEITKEMLHDPRVAAAARSATPDDRRLLVRLESLEDLTELSPDLEELHRGLARHLLGTGRFRLLPAGAGGADLLLQGRLEPDPEDGRAVRFVLRAVSAGSGSEVWSRALRLQPTARGTFLRS